MLHPFSPAGRGKMISDTSGLWYPKKDIDYLLAMLGRCVGVIERLWKNEDDTDMSDTLVAARALLEEEKE